MTSLIALKATSEKSPLFYDQEACESEYAASISDFDDDISEDSCQHQGR